MQRNSVNRNNDHSANAARQTHNRTGKSAAKPTDIEKFNAALRAKSDAREQPAKNESKQQQEITAGTIVPSSQILHSPVQTESVTSVLEHITSTAPAMPGGTSLMPLLGTGITLSATIPAGTTTAVQQAATIVQRILQNNTRSTQPKTWKLQLSIEGSPNITIQLEYHGKTDWAIGLLDEDTYSGHDQTTESSCLADELQSLLILNNPSLYISRLRMEASL